MGFATTTKGRSWMITVQIANFKKMGLKKREYEDPEYLVRFLAEKWEKSGEGRKCAFTVCISAAGLLHAHGALYGNLTTLKKVSDVYCQCHVEPQKGGKKALADYMEKKPPYDEKGEQVLVSYGIDNIEDRKGGRSDVKIIEEKLNNGEKPDEILESSFSFRRYEKSINAAFIAKKLKETPLTKKMRCEYIYGPSGSGKSYEYKKLADKEGTENIYLMTDYENGGLDGYMTQGAPHILFIDEFKGKMPYGTLLTILDVYSRAQVHCRYTNCYCLWDTVIITSVFSPYEVYTRMVPEEKDRETDSFDQFLRRLTIITNKYKKDNNYFSESKKASEYEVIISEPEKKKGPKFVHKGIDEAIESSKKGKRKK